MSINKIVIIRSITIALWLGVSVASLFVKSNYQNVDNNLLQSGLCFFSLSMLILILELIKVSNYKGWIIFVDIFFNIRI